ncbi:ribokinase [Williamsia muralis]|uniref:Ribokinase n=1 Tax=Williamsia marianensis TaxID=85044 RepID=A0ABU4EXZ1_WILMA|nr:ribokinase [Williamsia muralis]MDV7136105.1 ribokinase [Williamsia muralis]
MRSPETATASDVGSPLVAVVGTLNLDLVVRTDRRPRVGETVMGTSYVERPGGKGANQALAAADIGPTALIGAVGDDAAGTTMRRHQDAAGVDTRHVVEVAGASGRAVIEVDADGDNRIIVISGANDQLSANQVIAALNALAPKVVLTQLESPRSVTAAVAGWAEAGDCRFILNPSPVAPLDNNILSAADPLVVNAVEAEYYCGDRLLTDPGDMARRLLEVARSVVITLGARGVVVATGGSVETFDVEKVHAHDTTGAGDHFVGSLAAYLAAGSDLQSAARRSAARATDYVASPR